MLVVFAPAAFAEPNIEPEAEKVLRSVGVYMSSLNSLEMTISVTEESVYGDTLKLQSGGTKNVFVRNPSKLSVTTRTDTENKRVVLNDGKLTVFDEDVNVYTQVTVPKLLKEAIVALSNEYNYTPSGSELFGGQAYEALVEKASKVMYLGKGNVNGVACHHLAGILPDMDWQLWVRAEGDPQLCKYIVTDRSIPLAPQYSMLFTKWKKNTKIPDKVFEFRAPADAESIAIIK
jgi:hypothetical protein